MTRILRPLSFARHYATKYPRPRPGTAERPPVHNPDPLEGNPKAVVTQLPDENLTFIHRPPPTAPSPFSLTTAPASPLLQSSKPSPLTTEEKTGSPLPLPPISRPRLNKSPPPPPLERLSDEDVEKLRQLRRSDPQTYTRSKLAKMFGCTQTFVGAVAALKKSQRKAAIKKEEEKRSGERAGWSEKKALVREIRAKRRLLW